MKRASTSSALIVVLAMLSTTTHAEQVDMERYRAQRLAQARPMSLFGAHYSVEGDSGATLYLVNKIADPVMVELYAHGDAGQVLPFGRHILEPNRHLSVSLEEALGFAPPEARTGFLRVEYRGDEDTIQGWLILRRQDDLFEVPLTSPAAVSGPRLTSFWDARPIAGATSQAAPVYHLLNTSTAPVTASVRIRQAGNVVGEETVKIMPSARMTFRPQRAGKSMVFGALEIIHDEEPGALLGFGALTGRDGVWVRLPMIELDDQGLSRTYQSLRLQESGWTAFYNPNGKPLRLDVDFQDWQTGTVTSSRKVVIGPHSVRSLPVDTGGTARCRARGDLPFAVAGWGRNFESGLTEQTWFPASAVHPNGSYPLPDLDRHRVSHEMINLSESEARVVGQVDWDGGSFAFGPISIPPGGAHEIDFGEIAKSEDRDVLGRILDPSYRNGFFRWTSQGDGRLLLGRLQARETDGREAYGFNCSQCCPEMPFGSVVPGFLEFLPGETPSLQACVSYTTCNGTMGPFPATPTTIDAPPPFTWDGLRVGATEAADADLSFEALEQGTDLVCFSFLRLIFGKARAELCQETFNPMEYDSKTACSHQTSTCFHCNACCENIFQENLCRGKSIGIISGERNTCLGHCAEDNCV